MVLVTLTTLAAAAAPYLREARDHERIVATSARLHEISVGVNAFEVVVSSKFPGRISELTTPITRNSPNSCWQTNFSTNGGNADTIKWATGGAPYAASFMPTTNLYTPIGYILDSIPSRNGATNDSLWVTIPNVSANDARLLKLYVDGSIDSTRDTVRFHTPLNDTTTIRYRVTPRQLGKC